MRLNYSIGSGNIVNQKSRGSDHQMKLATADAFEDLYVRLKKKEGRYYSDSEVQRLPEIHQSHPHAEEWKVRKRSCRKLVAFLANKRRPLSILDIGCGVGWLSSRLSEIHGSRVIATDISGLEIEQAARVFSSVENLKFISGEWKTVRMERHEFDTIIFAAAAQYFSSIKDLVSQSLELLAENGEIHIIDSKFYGQEEIEAARNRSTEYYGSIGLPEMSSYYFHHSLSELDPFNYEILFDPFTLRNKIFNRNDPFHWIRIRK